jgi:hypothetical protein
MSFCRENDQFDLFLLGHDSLIMLQDCSHFDTVSSQEQSSWVFVSLREVAILSLSLC